MRRSCIQERVNCKERFPNHPFLSLSLSLSVWLRIRLVKFYPALILCEQKLAKPGGVPSSTCDKMCESAGVTIKGKYSWNFLKDFLKRHTRKLGGVISSDRHSLRKCWCHY